MCWGGNGSGDLGDGTTTGRNTPVDVIGLTSGVTAISAGGGHACALTVSGGAKCWGTGSQLGNGTGGHQYTPAFVVGLTSGVTAISAGHMHTCVLTASGGVKCWGINYSRQLGDGTNETKSAPTDVFGLNTGVTAIAAGGDQTCALTAGGGAKCWGENSDGQLGNGTNLIQNVPIDIPGLTGIVTAISAGDNETCATTTNGVLCWGSENYGDGATAPSHVPSVPTVAGMISGVSAISVGKLVMICDVDYCRYEAIHVCALTTDGWVTCWGDNTEGQLGNGYGNINVPVGVSGLDIGVIAIAAGGSYSCALTGSGGVKCWGYNIFGQLGDGTSTARYTSEDVTGLTWGVKAISAGDSHTCALTAIGGVKCWGDNQNGQLGDGTTTYHRTPVDVIGFVNPVSAIAAGGEHTCALTLGGVMCWGNNDYGQLGDGATTSHYVPTYVTGLSGGIAAITAGRMHTCALTNIGGVKCWGANGDGQLGDGAKTDRFTPVSVVGLSFGVKAISAGENHTCALTTIGVMKCWGSSGNGQLGINPGWTPVDVVDR